MISGCEIILLNGTLMKMMIANINAPFSNIILHIFVVMIILRVMRLRQTMKDTYS